MRKTVIDGSNTSGFQRTMLVGMNGWIVVNEKRIGIDTVCLEEDACQVIERKNDSDVYNLSRLGIPLIEIATAANIINPQEAKDAAAKLGMLLRSIPNCKRGIGSIRQDVNLSIKGGSRVEIKGFQELKGIPKIIEFEVERHLMIIKKGEQVPNEVRKAEGNLTTSFLRPTPGSDGVYPETDIPEILPDTSLILRIDTIEEKTSMMAKDYGLSQELASQVARAGIDLAKLTAKYTNVEAKLIADTLISYPKEIKSRFGKKVDAMLHADDLFARLERGELPNSAVFEILSDIAHAKKPDFSKYAAISLHELEREVKELVEKNKDATIQALMGLLMQKHRGKVEGKTVMELVKKHKK
jgi:Glu-tRNA(Gln) amidotransferase subunit E-like FAD-binding protein